jgi:secreted trypsin-like serine protease
MKLINLVLFQLLIAFAACERSSNFIVGGENATVADYPYMAGVLNFGLPSCGGSIITARSVLTVKFH